MAPFEEAQMCIHAADHGLQKLVALFAFHFSHLAGTLKSSVLSSFLQTPDYLLHFTSGGLTGLAIKTRLTAHCRPGTQALLQCGMALFLVALHAKVL